MMMLVIYLNIVMAPIFTPVTFIYMDGQSIYMDDVYKVLLAAGSVMAIGVFIFYMYNKQSNPLIK
jgi:hypothetical protein